MSQLNVEDIIDESAFDKWEEPIIRKIVGVLEYQGMSHSEAEKTAAIEFTPDLRDYYIKFVQELQERSYRNDDQRECKK